MQISVKFKKIAKVADDYFRKLSDEEIKLWKSKIKIEEEINPSDVLKEEIVDYTFDQFEDTFRDASDDDFVPKEKDNFDDFFNSTGPEDKKKVKKKKPKASKCHCGVVLSCERRLKEHIMTRHQEIPFEDYVPCHVS